MTVVRNYIEPNWFARALNFQPLRWVYEHVPYLYLVFHAFIPENGTSPRPWRLFETWTLDNQIRNALGLRGVGWFLARVGYRVHGFNLEIEQERDVACCYCDQGASECTCGNTYLQIVGTTYSVNGQPVPEDVYQAEFDLFYRLNARGLFIERMVRGVSGVQRARDE